MYFYTPFLHFYTFLKVLISKVIIYVCAFLFAFVNKDAYTYIMINELNTTVMKQLTKEQIETKEVFLSYIKDMRSLLNHVANQTRKGKLRYYDVSLITDLVKAKEEYKY